jgi:hypothetical protein
LSANSGDEPKVIQFAATHYIPIKGEIREMKRMSVGYFVAISPFFSAINYKQPNCINQ